MSLDLVAPSQWSVRRGALQAATVAAYMAVAMTVYFLIAHDGNDAATSTKSAFDAAIPLVPAFVWIYISPYLVSPFLVVGASREVFRCLVHRGTLVVLLQLLFFFVFPTVVDRAPLDAAGGQTLSEQMLAWVYAIDTPPRNAAPSGHVSLVLVLAWGASQSVGRYGVLVWSFAALVSVSIVFTKQHHVIDLVTGALLGALVLVGVAWWERRRGVGAKNVRPPGALDSLAP